MGRCGGEQGQRHRQHAFTTRSRTICRAPVAVLHSLDGESVPVAIVQGLRQVLQPGLYYVNTKEYQVIPAEVGIVQTTFTKGRSGEPNTAITVTG